jgi:predicted PurR-regulated permease PerM
VTQNDQTKSQGSVRQTGRHRLHAWGELSWDLLRVLALLAVMIWLLLQVKLVVIPLMLGAFVASLGTPLVSRLLERGVPRLVATWIVVLIWLTLATLLTRFLVAEIQGAADQMQTALTDAWEQLQEWLEAAPFGVDSQSLPQTLEQFFSNFGADGQGIGQSVASGVETATEAVAGLFLTIIVAFFLIKDGYRFWDWLLSKIPARHREKVDAAGASAWVTLRRYLTGTAVVGVVNATAVAIALIILDVPLVIPLAIVMFVGAFFPLVGAIISGSVIALIVLATNGVTDALIVAGVVIVVQQLEGDLVAPLVLGRAVALHPLLILFGIAAGFVIGGIVGAFLTVPFIAIAAEVTRTLRPEILRTE